MLDLLDLNVWLALADADHEYHTRAKKYWETEAGKELAFCRVTMLGLLRLLTNRKVMRNNPFSAQEAWQAYRVFLALPEVIFLDESKGTDSQMANWSDTPIFAPHRWTDCYLAALAQVSGARLVTFDVDFRVFSGLSYLRLVPES